MSLHIISTHLLHMAPCQSILDSIDHLHASADQTVLQGLNTLFWETAMRLTDSRSHAVVHCVPLDDSSFHRAKVVFKKSLDEAESEWSQHQAKAAIDTKLKVLLTQKTPTR